MKMKTFATFVKKSLKISKLKVKKIVQLDIIVIKQVNTAHGICNLKYSLHKEIPINFHNYGSNYDYHFTIKELVETKSYRLQFIDSS